MELRACVLVIAIAAACERPPNISCAEVGAHIASTLEVLQPENGTERIPLRDAMSRRCSVDGWSVDARTCMSKITSPTETVTCSGELTESQIVALGEAFAQLARDEARELERMKERMKER